MKIIVISDFHGMKEVIEPLNNLIDNEKPDVVVFCGDIVKGYARGNEWLSSKKLNRKPDKEKTEIKNEEKEDLMLYDYFYKNIRKNVPVLVVPGNMDAPEERYFSALLNLNTRKLFQRNQRKVFERMRRNSNRNSWHFRKSQRLFRKRESYTFPTIKNLYPLHEQMFFKDKYVFAGFGGEITENKEEKFFVLRYSKEKVKPIIDKVKQIEKEKILVFHSPPVSKVGKEGDVVVGSNAVNEIIDEIKPKILFCGHAHKASGTDVVKNTLCVNPGPLKYRNAAVVDSESMDVRFVKL